MSTVFRLSFALRVALLAEGVDRNFARQTASITTAGSPSSRRAWIEIRTPQEPVRRSAVALLAEGVDRNPRQENDVFIPLRRPPRGGRG